MELWRTTIRDVKVSLWNTSKVSGVFFVTSNYICYTICLYGQKNDLVTYNEFLTTNKKWEHPTANRKLPSLEKYYFILLISKGLYIKTSLRVMALEISIYSKNETGQNSITLPDWQVIVRELLSQFIAWISVGFWLVRTGLVRMFIISPLSSAQY